MVDYIDDWNEFFDVTTKYKSYWRDSFRDFMDDSDEENYYERPFLTSSAPLSSYTVEDWKFLRNDPVISKDCGFFYSLVDDTKQVDFNIIGAGTAFRYTIVGGRSDRKAEIIVFSFEGIYTICENLENKKRVYDKREDAGAYILKWILGHIN